MMEPEFGNELSIVHSNKSQNYRLKSIEQFDNGNHRIMITTDVMARGLDFDKMSHVFNFDTPDHPENYIHRIGRTGRAGHIGKSILFYTEKEEESKIAIEILMSREIDLLDFPKDVLISHELIPEERPRVEESNYNRNAKKHLAGPSTHEKKAKNKKVNLGGSYRRELAKKYKKPQTRGDKIQNLKKKGKK
jgi:ATP-dependent RNA helicase RhlE